MKAKVAVIALLIACVCCLCAPGVAFAGTAHSIHHHTKVVAVDADGEQTSSEDLDGQAGGDAASDAEPVGEQGNDAQPAETPADTSELSGSESSDGPSGQPAEPSAPEAAGNSAGEQPASGGDGTSGGEPTAPEQQSQPGDVDAPDDSGVSDVPDAPVDQQADDSASAHASSSEQNGDGRPSGGAQDKASEQSKGDGSAAKDEARADKCQAELEKAAKVVKSLDDAVMSGDIVNSITNGLFDGGMAGVGDKVRKAAEGDDLKARFSLAAETIRNLINPLNDFLSGVASHKEPLCYEIARDELENADAAEKGAQAFKQWASMLTSSKDALPIVMVADAAIDESNAGGASVSAWLKAINEVSSKYDIVFMWSGAGTSDAKGGESTSSDEPGGSIKAGKGGGVATIGFGFKGAGQPDSSFGTVITIGNDQITAYHVGLDGIDTAFTVSLTRSGQDNAPEPTDPTNPTGADDPVEPGNVDVPADGGSSSNVDEPANPTQAGEKGTDPKQNEQPGKSDKPEKPGKSDKPEKNSDSDGGNNSQVNANYLFDGPMVAGVQASDDDNGPSGTRGAQPKNANALFDPPSVVSSDTKVENKVDEMLGRAEGAGAEDPLPADEDRTAPIAAFVVVLISAGATLVACKGLHRAA